MLYLNTQHLLKIGVDWSSIADVIRNAVVALSNHEYSQPVKPYLRYKAQHNRIIAMPAYVGGTIECAGIKWIASFPDNIKNGMPRAHAVTILNDAGTGRPLGVINSGLLSAIRTAGVSALMIREFLAQRQVKGLQVGIVGFGPIGKMHLDMVNSLYGDLVDRYVIFDLDPARKDDLPKHIGKVQFANAWEDCYTQADIFITCTVSKERYISKPPKQGSLQLNVSLRDFTPEFRRFTNTIVVDDWEEVCRENTDIEMMHKHAGLRKEDTLSMVDVVCGQALQSAQQPDVVMFNPMGMAVFDISVGKHFLNLATEQNVGVLLDD